MITLRATVGALLLLLTAVGTAAAKLDAPSDVRILAYDVSLDLDFSAKTVVGAETITVQSLIDGLESMSFSTNSAAVTPNLDDRAGLIESMIEGNRRILRFVRPLSLGQIAHISFVFHPTDGKGVVFGPDFVYANYFTCSVIICDQDYPAAKAPVDFSLSTPAGMRAVAPGRRTKRFTVAGRTYWSWHDDRPTAPYLLGFAAGKFHAVRLPGRGPRLTVLATDPSARRVRKMFADTRRMLRFFERVSGVRYESAPYTQVLVPGDEAQEAARHSIIGTDEIEPILKDPQEDWVIAHELAHQWWGNSLTCADWSELWLNEGLTVFMVAAYKEQRWGRAAYDRELELAHKRWDAAKAQNFDVPLSWQGEYPSLKLKRAMAYAKAVVFLDKLRRDLGDEPFWRAIKAYTTDHRNGVVTALDLEQAFEAASGQNLAPLFAEWVFGPAVPPRDTP